MNGFKSNILLIYKNKLILLFIFIFLIVPIINNTYIIFSTISPNGTIFDTYLGSTDIVPVIYDFYDSIITISPISYGSNFLLLCLFVPFIISEDNKGIHYNFNKGFKDTGIKLVVISIFILIMGLIYYLTVPTISLINMKLIEPFLETDLHYDFYKYSTVIFINILLAILFCNVLFFVLLNRTYAFLYYIIFLLLYSFLNTWTILLIFCCTKICIELTKHLRRIYVRAYKRK